MAISREAMTLQGEPLNNYAAVKAAVTMLTDGRYFSLQRQKVTVSTVGVIPKVLQVSDLLTLCQARPLVPLDLTRCELAFAIWSNMEAGRNHSFFISVCPGIVTERIKWTSFPLAIYAQYRTITLKVVPEAVP